jgi:hypothetical protein
MAVNPKKLRPYDQPPKVRRPILPSEPDNAATAFLVAALVWFLVATGIGVLWTALQLFPEALTIRLEMPTFSGVLTFELSPATTTSGFWNSLVYGWLGNAGLGAVFFITPRLVGRRLMSETMASASAALWNVGLIAGLVALYVPQLTVSGALTEFPLPVDGALLLALLLANAAFWRTVLSSRSALREHLVPAWRSSPRSGLRPGHGRELRAVRDAAGRRRGAGERLLRARPRDAVPGRACDRDAVLRHPARVGQSALLGGHGDARLAGVARAGHPRAAGRPR